jgi:hypothetical protein
MEKALASEAKSNRQASAAEFDNAIRHFQVTVYARTLTP